MCEENLSTITISILYTGFCLFIPIYYLYKFKNYKAKKKNYIRAFIISLIMFLILYSVKIISHYIGDNKIDCYINQINLINIEKKIDYNDEVTTTTTTTEATTTTTTTTATKTTKSSSTLDNTDFVKVEEPNGEKISVGTTSNGYELYTIDGAYYIDGILIANKTYALPSTFVPTNTYKSAVGVTSVCNTCINKLAYSAWTQMKADATSLGLNIWIQSGYRPYVSQEKIYNSYVKSDGQEKADTYSSRPGHSDHQTGLAFDLNSITDAFGNTDEGKWVNNNCYKYGFIIRFPKGKQAYTGYKYESWHLRYVGVELATILYNDGDWLSLEEYYGITSEYTS